MTLTEPSAQADMAYATRPINADEARHMHSTRTHFRPCPDCSGHGLILGQDNWHGDAVANATTCPACDGAGGHYADTSCPPRDALLRWNGYGPLTRERSKLRDLRERRAPLARIGGAA